MNHPIRVLLVEDSANDALLLLRQLRKGGYEPISVRVDSAENMQAALEKETWDIVISDYVIPGFGGLQALEVLKSKGLDLPFIIVWGRARESLLQDSQAWLEAIHPEDLPHVRQTWPKLGRGELEFRLLRPDGKVRWIHYRAFPILDEAGRAHRIAAIAEDITPRKQ